MRGAAAVLTGVLFATTALATGDDPVETVTTHYDGTVSTGYNVTVKSHLFTGPNRYPASISLRASRVPGVDSTLVLMSGSSARALAASLIKAAEVLEAAKPQK